jgi:hypothetical protein
MNGFYENSGYVNKRNRKQVLILDVSDEGGETFLGAGTEFSVDLFEPLIIDSLSEVYLDNFITYNSNISNQADNSEFVLRINEFNMNSNVASSNNNNTIFNSLLIPNEHSSVSNNQTMIIQKAKKFNYVCDINPSKIGRISGTITNLAGGPIFHGSGTSDKFTYALTGIDSGKLSRLIKNGEKFTGMTGATSVAGSFLATHFSTSTTLHFSTDTEITTIEVGGSNTSIVFTGVTLSDGTSAASTSITVTNNSATSDNPNLTLITNAGRFIAEFSINSRE